MKKTSLLLVSLLTAGSMSAQNGLVDGVGGELVSLLPQGVTATIENNAKGWKKQDLVVAGNPDKGYLAFFAAANEANGEELWVTDGTAAGTKMVKDIAEGPNSSNVNNLTRFNDKVVFAANDGENGSQLWVSDGTKDGTYMILINEIGDADPRGFVQLNETQFVFGAKNFDSETYIEGSPQWWLWVSDGTEANTEMIYECATDFPGGYATTMATPWCRVGRRVFFKGDSKDKEYGIELWVTDGTTTGTHLVKDINVEPDKITNAGIDQMVNFFNEKLFFLASDVEHGPEPWATDGTEAGTYLIKDTDPTVNENGRGVGGGVSAPAIKPYKGKIWFRGGDPILGKELACTNMEKGDYTIIDINKNDYATTEPIDWATAAPSFPIEFDGMLVFNANTGKDPNKPETNFGAEQMYTDGETVTFPASWDLCPGYQSHFGEDPVIVAGSLYWRNNSSHVIDYKGKLYRLDAIDQTPKQITNLNPDGDGIHSLCNVGGKLLFATADKALYSYTYRKEGYDAEKDADKLEPEYRTRQEIEDDEQAGIAATNTDVAVLYPNPTDNQFSFSIAGQALSVKIFDTLGRMVKEEKQLSGNTVDVTTLANGMYKVVIAGTEGSAVSSLVINK